LHLSKTYLTIGLPFLELSLRWSDGIEKTFYCDAYFSYFLKEKSIMLVVKKDKEESFPGVLIEKNLPFNIESGHDYINMQWTNYINMKKEVADIRGSSSRQRLRFAHRYGISESFRLLFGGFLTGPPEPEISEASAKKILLDFYEQILFRKMEKPIVLRDVKKYFPFAYYVDRREIVYLGNDKSKFKHSATVLTAFLRRQLITIPI